MTYITHRRFRKTCLSGQVNIPALTQCEEVNGIIIVKNRPICCTTSENAHQYFAINEDGCGLKRGQLTQAIQNTLSKRDALYQMRWDIVWGDFICSKYKRTDYNDYWLWNHEFFNAPISDLVHIANLIGIKGDMI